MRNRVDQLGVAEPEIQTSGGNQITVGLPNVSDTARAEAEVGTTAQLSFYDWEANVLTPNGKTVAEPAPDPGSDRDRDQPGDGTHEAPGRPGCGEHEPLRRGRARLQAAGVVQHRRTRGSAPQYWMFGAPGSAACAAAAKANGTVPVAGQHCLLSGPDDNKADLLSGPARRASARPRVRSWSCPAEPWCFRRFPQSFSKPTPIADPSAQFFVLKDNVALRGSDITNPEQSTDPNSGEPDVTFGFSSKGKKEFQNVTANDRAPRRPGQRPRADAQPALRGRARQPADHGPVHRLQAVPGRDQRRQRRRHQRQLHDHLGAGPRQRAAPGRAADQPQADLRVAGVGDARQAGAAQRPDRGPDRAAGRGRSS